MDFDVSIPIKTHPACLDFQISLAFLIGFFAPLEDSHLDWWNCFLAVKHGAFYLIGFFCALGFGFWSSWRLLTNSLSAIYPNDIMQKKRLWWLFLFSFPIILFSLFFLFRELPDIIKMYTMFGGFISLLIVDVLSGRYLPFPKGISIDSNGQMTIPFSAFAKLAKQEIPANRRNILISNLNEFPINAPLVRKRIPFSHSLTPILQSVLNDSYKEVQSSLQEHPEHLNTAYAQNGNTPLHVAALNGQTEIVKLLLEQPGIDKTIKNNDGKTAFDLAQEKGFAEIADLLK